MKERVPGGLTALAVINLLFLAGHLLVALSLVAVLAAFNMDSLQETRELQDAKRQFDEAGITMGFFIGVLALVVTSTLLLLFSGIGYLKQKKFLGRGLGSAYGLLAFVSSGLSAAMLPEAGGGGFTSAP